MKPLKLENIAVLMGLSYNVKTNYKDTLEKGIRVFDGVNGQRFLIDSNDTDEEIFKKLGKALILMGKREKCMEIRNVLSINSD